MFFIKFSFGLFFLFSLIAPAYFAHAALSSLHFNGSSDYIEVADNTILDLAGGGTVELWFRKDSHDNNEWQLLAGKVGDTDSEQPWTVYLYDGDDINIVGAYFGNGTTFEGVESATSVFQNNNTWTHLVVTWQDPGDGTIEVRIYVNGEETAYSPDNIVSGISLGYVNDNPVLLGAAYTPADRFYWYNGDMDEVRIYSRVLGASEVTDHYNKTFDNNSELIALWHFDDASGGTAGDSSGNDLDGTLTGASWLSDGVDMTIPPPPPPAPQVTTGGIPAYRPEVTIISPKKKDVFGDAVTISYTALDGNDETGNEGESERLGLGEAPVALYYSETADIRKRKLIAKELPAIGEFVWDTTGPPDGTTYWIIVEAVDNSGEVGQKTVGAFSLDHEAPTFVVEATPPFSRGEDVSLLVRSSKPLAEPPDVTVTQHDFQPVEVAMEGDGSEFKGTYHVFTDYDGTAAVSVKGKDSAGNIGTTIVSGKTFSINSAPPSQPIITSPLDRDIFETETVRVTGRARDDVVVSLAVNGVEAYQVKPERNGDFLFPDVVLDPGTPLGTNLITVVSHDTAGTVSDEASITVTINSRPEVTIITPERGAKLAGTTVIRIGARDRNNDALVFTYEISSDSGETWKVLRDKTEEESVRWDTREYADGTYLLRVTADDGFAKTAVRSERFSIVNLSPTISFEEERTVTNKNTVVVAGNARGRVSGSFGGVISLEYSEDDGTTWLAATAQDGEFNGPSEDFSFTITEMVPGLHEILVRAQDRRGFVGFGKKIIIVDSGPPPTPTVTFPTAGFVLRDEDDVRDDVAGIQFEIRGSAEPENDIRVKREDSVFEGESGADGFFAVTVTVREPGENTFTVSSIDLAGNKSTGEAVFSVVYNNPPQIKLRWPRVGGGLNHVAEIVFEIQDRELDKITESSLGYRRVGARETNILARNMEGNTFQWDVSDFEEGTYELVLTASDGVSERTLRREFFIDNTEPTVEGLTLPDTVFTEPTRLGAESSARDDFSGIEYVEYSVDNKNWYKTLITEGYKEKSARSQFEHPYELEDGRHTVSVRATDASGNVSEAVRTEEIVVDTSAPRVGSFTLSRGPFLLFPERDLFTVPLGTVLDFTVSLEGDTQNASVAVGDTVYALAQERGLWKKKIVFDTLGAHALTITAEDTFGNVLQDKQLGTVVVVPPGRVLSVEEKEDVDNTAIHIFVFNEEDQSWVRWQAEAYGFANPLILSEKGEYALLLPAGTYRLVLEKQGYRRLKSSDFTLTSPRFITESFILEAREGLRGFFEDVLEKVTFNML